MPGSGRPGQMLAQAAWELLADGLTASVRPCRLTCAHLLSLLLCHPAIDYRTAASTLASSAFRSPASDCPDPQLPKGPAPKAAASKSLNPFSRYKQRYFSAGNESGAPILHAIFGECTTSAAGAPGNGASRRATKGTWDARGRDSRLS